MLSLIIPWIWKFMLIRSARLHIDTWEIFLKIRPYITKDACESLVHVFITSRLDSVNAVLYGLPKFLTEKLQRVQNFSARLITGPFKYDHITPVLKSLHWLPVEQRIRHKIAVLGFKCVYGSAPGYLQNLVELYTPRRTLGISSDNFFYPESENTLWWEVF